MPNLDRISSGLNWRVYQKKQLSFGFEYETDDEFIELTYERFQKEWEEVADININLENLKQYWTNGGNGNYGSFLFFVTNSNPYGEWVNKFSKPYEEDLKLGENSLSAWELDMKKPNARSTSVGDIYQDLDNNKYFMIMSTGFKQVRLRNLVDSDSARAQTKTVQSFPQGFYEANKMWKAVLKKAYPDLIGMPVYGMSNRGFMVKQTHGIFKHIGNGKYEIVKDFENWASSMEPMQEPNTLLPGELKIYENILRENKHLFDSYKGTEVYVNLFQGGDEDARYD